MSYSLPLSEELCLELSDWDIIQLLHELGVDQQIAQKEFRKCREAKFRLYESQKSEENSGMLDEEILDVMTNLRDQDLL